MENDQPGKLDKKLFIKKALVNIVIAMAFCFLPTFITYGRIPIKPFLIILGFCIVLGSTIAFFATKYDNHIMSTQQTRAKRKWLRITMVSIIVLAAGIVFLRPGIFTEREEISIDKNVEYSESIYRNLKYRFSIKFPEDWEIKEEVDNGTFFIKEAIFQNSTIRVSARLVDLKGGQGFSSIKDTRPLKEFIDAFFEVTKENIPNAKIINYSEVKINNEFAYLMESSMDSQVILTYFFAKGDIMYSIGAGTISEEYSKLKPLFIQTISTFAFENH